MKTAREKAESWLEHKVPGYSTDQLIGLTVLLKEQDRDTRHACAEAVIGCKNQHVGPFMGSPRILKDEAHSAIMNTKAV